MGEGPLMRIHFFDGETLSFLGYKMPVEALLAFEFEGGFGPFLFRQRGQESLGRFHHVLTHAVSKSRSTKHRRQDQQRARSSQKWFHNFIPHPKTSPADNSFRAGIADAY